ncbi:hypothetical protein [Ruegeria conchae]|uniref:hypothetical protein n=1 Tax=Ruegeria conchae TaxID=981384 RepID=UPI000237A9BE|nr:hypothetical protein [Ruegeria conchae]
MAENADKYFPTSNDRMFKDNAQFFKSADDASEYLREADFAVLELRLRTHFTARDSDWLLRGA